MLDGSFGDSHVWQLVLHPFRDVNFFLLGAIYAPTDFCYIQCLSVGDELADNLDNLLFDGMEEASV